jgi:hypothetical protein
MTTMRNRATKIISLALVFGGQKCQRLCLDKE